MFYLRSAGAGLLLGVGILAAVVGRIIFTITAGRRWYQAREFLKG